MLVLSLKREEKFAGEAKLLQALGCCSLWKNKHWCLYRLASLNSCVVKNFAERIRKDLCQKKKGKGDTFCKDIFLVCELASLDKSSLVNWLVDGELHWLENIIKIWLLCLHAAQYASLYAAARCHCTAWGQLVILPRRSSVKPPVQETRMFGKFNTWAWQCRRYPALTGHAKRGERYLVIPWMQTIMHGVPAWIVCCSVAWHIWYSKHLNNFFIGLNEI